MDEIIDVLINYATVVKMFDKLLEDIAHHPDFGHQYACYCILDDSQYDKATEDAEKEWNRLIVAGAVKEEVLVQKITP